MNCGLGGKQQTEGKMQTEDIKCRLQKAFADYASVIFGII